MSTKLVIKLSFENAWGNNINTVLTKSSYNRHAHHCWLATSIYHDRVGCLHVLYQMSKVCLCRFQRGRANKMRQILKNDRKKEECLHTENPYGMVCLTKQKRARLLQLHESDQTQRWERHRGLFEVWTLFSVPLRHFFL